MGNFDRFIRDVICAPYTIPIGIIHSNISSIDYCTKSRSSSYSLDETNTDASSMYSKSLEFSDSDILTRTQYSSVSRAIQQILLRTNNISLQDITSSSVAKVSRIALDDDGLPIMQDGNILPVFDNDEQNIELAKLETFYTLKKGDDGNIYAVWEYGCIPSIEQTTSLSVTQINLVNSNTMQEILNNIQVEMELSLEESGSEDPSSTISSVFSNTAVFSLLIQRVNGMLTNLSSQIVSSNANINYIDRYGKCNYVYNDNMELILNKNPWCRRILPTDNLEEKNVNGVCVSNKGAHIKQSITIDVIAKNIIDITIGLYKETDVSISSKTDVSIQRITNNRVIVASLLLNIIILYLFSSFFSFILNNI
jgi:hypothetical protein